MSGKNNTGKHENRHGPYINNISRHHYNVVFRLPGVYPGVEFSRRHPLTVHRYIVIIINPMPERTNGKTMI